MDGPVSSSVPGVEQQADHQRGEQVGQQDVGPQASPLDVPVHEDLRHRPAEEARAPFEEQDQGVEKALATRRSALVAEP